MAEQPDKVCIFCGTSCAAQPRVKDERGRYAHQTCAKQAASRPAAPPTPPAGDDPDDALLGLLDDINPAAPDPGPGALRQACPGCGAALNPDAVICTGCGFNTQTGKGLKTKVAKQRPAKPGAVGAVAGAAGEFAAAGATFLVGSLLGGAVGAAIGAAVWAGIIIGTGYQVGYVAIGVGALCGFGTAIGSRGQTGAMTGVIAVLFAVLGICAGKAVGVAYYVNKEFGDSGIIARMTGDDPDRFMLQVRTDEAVQRILDTGDLDEDEYDYYAMLLEDGEYPHDYPENLVAEVEEAWRALSDEERAAAIAAEEACIQGVVLTGGFMSTFRFRDVIFFLLAIGVAYKVGSGSE